MFLPGEGVPVPIFWSIYEQYAMGAATGGGAGGCSSRLSSA
jgi:hypothetical protein